MVRWQSLVKLLTLAIWSNPLRVWTWLISVSQRVLIRSGLVCKVLSSICSDISAENSDIGEELSDFRVGEEELGDNSKVLDGFLSLGSSSLLVNWSRSALEVLLVRFSIDFAGVCS
jgi:hypothetical protein